MAGLNFDQAIAKAEQIGEGARISVTITTNQDDGIVSYITGNLVFHKRQSSGHFLIPEHIASDISLPLTALFSNIPDGLSMASFSTNNPADTDSVGLNISYALGSITATFTVQKEGLDILHSCSFTMQRMGNLLVGIGAPINNTSLQAVYTVSFNGVFSNVIPK